jgi:hypothetical protein
MAIPAAPSSNPGTMSARGATRGSRAREMVVELIMTAADMGRNARPALAGE